MGVDDGSRERKRVVVAMSGGVDSSVAAALLMRRGYQVMGLTMQFGPRDEQEEGGSPRGCCFSGAVTDARRVAGALGIPHQVMNLCEPFQEKVVDYFVQEYGRGRTPNPCALCNQRLKFGELLQRALEMGADGLATGHYARTRYDEARGRYLLLRGRDPRKDQSYTLSRLTQYQLRRAWFPLGDLHKDEIRELAADWDLPVAAKPDSQDICFIPDGDYRGFLSRRIPRCIRSGPIVDVSGHRLGTHSGLPFYTVGQRRGLGLSAAEPLYVLALDTDRNALVVGSRKDLECRSVLAEDPNWIALDPVQSRLSVEAVIRYNARPVTAELEPLSRQRLLVSFRQPLVLPAPAPGQIIAFYQGDIVLGSGFIAKSRGQGAP